MKNQKEIKKEKKGEWTLERNLTGEVEIITAKEFVSRYPGTVKFIETDHKDSSK